MSIRLTFLKYKHHHEQKEVTRYINKHYHTDRNPDTSTSIAIHWEKPSLSLFSYLLLLWHSKHIHVSLDVCPLWVKMCQAHIAARCPTRPTSGDRNQCPNMEVRYLTHANGSPNRQILNYSPCHTLFPQKDSRGWHVFLADSFSRVWQDVKVPECSRVDKHRITTEQLSKATDSSYVNTDDMNNNNIIE